MRQKCPARKGCVEEGQPPDTWPRDPGIGVGDIARGGGDTLQNFEANIADTSAEMGNRWQQPAKEQDAETGNQGQRHGQVEQWREQHPCRRKEMEVDHHQRKCYEKNRQTRQRALPDPGPARPQHPRRQRPGARDQGADRFPLGLSPAPPGRFQADERGDCQE